MSDTPITIAVIGSGPSGCYLAQALQRGAPGARITVFDRLAAPFGLIRYGVAADHQHTKAITRQFERLFQHPDVRFAGNVEIGRDVSLAELRAAYDVVVLATGLTADRPLALPGADLPGVIGAGTLTRILNSHPGERPALPELGDDVVIVGGGNVAIDLLRFLVKSAEDYDASDIADHALESYLAHPAARVTLLNRSSAADAKSDPQMLKELAALPRASYRARGFDPAPPEGADRTATARLLAISELTRADRVAHGGPEVTVRFGAAPVRILGSDRVTGVEIAGPDGAEEIIPATAVLTAIGFSADDHVLSDLTADPADTGRIEPGLYRTGWAKRGPRGAIPENRSCAKSVADEVLADLSAGAIALGHAGDAALSPAVSERAVSYADWGRLDAHEREAAGPNRIRRKLTDHTDMVAVALGRD